MSQSLDPSLMALHRGFLTDALAAVRELEALLRSGGEREESIRTHAHRLRGTGGAYGYGALSEAAGALEEAWLAQADVERLASLASELEREVRLPLERLEEVG